MSSADPSPAEGKAPDAEKMMTGRAPMGDAELEQRRAFALDRGRELDLRYIDRIDAERAAHRETKRAWGEEQDRWVAMSKRALAAEARVHLRLLDDLAALNAAGFAIVPQEPTEAMIKASCVFNRHHVTDCFKAMLAAGQVRPDAS